MPRQSRSSAVVLLTVLAAAAAGAVAPCNAVTRSGAVLEASGHPSTTEVGAPATASLGRWRVLARDTGAWEVSWTAPAPLPVAAARPEVRVLGPATGPAASVVPARIGADGRTVTAVVTTPAPPRAGQLDVVLSGHRLDEPGWDPAGEADIVVKTRDEVAPAAPPPSTLLPTDPAAAGPYAVTASDYQLRRLRVVGLARRVEVVGHVVEPAPDADTGPRPLVVLLHGRHPWCYDPAGGVPGYADPWPCAAPQRELPNHLGFDYLQRRLAFQGFTTVSILANGISAQDGPLLDAGAAARAALVRRHLRYWATVATQHRVDLSRVVLVGHSRGGEGVDRAATEIPLDAPYRIVGQVLLAPTDVAAHAAPYVPTVVVLPACDGDVSDLQGQRYVDASRDVLDDDTALRSSVMVMGANHNFFNTEWTPGASTAPSYDDWRGPARERCGRRHPDRLSAREQRDVGLAVVAAGVRLFTGVDDSGLPLLDGSGARTASMGHADVRSHALGGGRDLRRPGRDAAPTRGAAAATSLLCRGAMTPAKQGLPVCGRDIGYAVTPHWRTEGDLTPTRPFLELAWSSAGAVGGLRLDRPLDLSTGRLELRTIVDHQRGPAEVRVRLTDGAGRSVDVDPLGGRRLAPLPAISGSTKVWAQALLADPASAPGSAAVDLADIRVVELVAVRGDGRVWIADVSAAPDRLAVVPQRRAPRIDLGTVRGLVEGDPPRGVGTDTRTVQVPFTLSEPSSSRVRFAVAMLGQGPDQAGPHRTVVVDLPPGRTSGVVPVTYTRDRRDDHPVETIVSAYPLRGAATGASAVAVRVADDDPLPTFRILTPRRVVTEGEDAVFRIVVTGGRDYSLYAAPVVHQTRRLAALGARRDLTGMDVPAAWFRPHALIQDRSKPLWRAEMHFGETLGPRARVLDFRVPTRVDGRREGVEALTVVVMILERDELRTVLVRDATP